MNYFNLRVLAACCALLPLLHTVHAQDTTLFRGAEHSLTTGLFRSWLKVEGLSSGATLLGHGNSVHYAYSYTGARRITTVALGFDRSAYSGGSLVQRTYNLSLFDGFRVVQHKAFTGYVGYALTTRPSYLEGATKEQAVYSWNSTNTLALYQHYRYRWNTNLLQLNLTLPVVGIAYAREGALTTSAGGSTGHKLSTIYSNPSFASLHNLQALTASLGYTKQLTRIWGLSMQWNLEYNHSAAAAQKQLTQGVGLSLQYRVKR